MLRRLFPLVVLCGELSAGQSRVLIDGAGCRTRQEAIRRIFEKMPEIRRVTILPRREAPADNQRVFLVETKAGLPTKEALIEALGRRGKFYRVLEVEDNTAR